MAQPQQKSLLSFFKLTPKQSETQDSPVQVAGNVVQNVREHVGCRETDKGLSRKRKKASAGESGMDKVECGEDDCIIDMTDFEGGGAEKCEGNSGKTSNVTAQTDTIDFATFAQTETKLKRPEEKNEREVCTNDTDRSRKLRFGQEHHAIEDANDKIEDDHEEMLSYADEEMNGRKENSKSRGDSIPMDEYGIIKSPESPISGMKLTPLEQQVLALKKRYQNFVCTENDERTNCDIDVLAIEVGYKYRFFGHDAILVCRLLSNLCCYRDRCFMGATIPVHKITTYVRRIVSFGYKVGVVRQFKTGDTSIADNGGFENCFYDGFISGGGRDPFLRRLVGVFTLGTIEAGMRSLRLSPTAVTGLNKVDKQDEVVQKPVYNPFLKRLVYPKVNLGNQQDISLNSMLEDDFSDNNVSSFILCILESVDNDIPEDEMLISVIVVEVSCGEVIYDSFQDDNIRSKLQTVCTSMQPVEILLLDSSKQTRSIVKEYTDRTRLYRDCHVRIKNLKHSRSRDSASAMTYISGVLDRDDAKMSEVALLPNPCVICFSYVLSYLNDFNLCRALSLKFKPYSNERQYMRVNSNALMQLDIVGEYDYHFNGSEPTEFVGERSFKPAKENSIDLNNDRKAKSLLSLLDHTITKPGRRMIRDWLLHPLINSHAIIERLDAVECFIKAKEFGNKDENMSEGRKVCNNMLISIASNLRNIRKVDIERGLMKIHQKMTSPREFYIVFQSIRQFADKIATEMRPLQLDFTLPDDPEFKKVLPSILLRSSLQNMNVALLAKMNNFSLLFDAKSANDNNVSNMFLKAKNVKRTEFLEVHEAKVAYDNVVESLEDELGKLLIHLTKANNGLKNKIPRLEYKHMNDKEYLIELNISSKIVVPPDWKVVSMTKQKVRYMPDSVSCLYQELQEKHKAIDSAGNKCFNRLLGILCGDVEGTTLESNTKPDTATIWNDMWRASLSIKTFDAINSMAKASSRLGYSRPHFICDTCLADEEIRLEITAGKHPILENQFDSEYFVPNDANMCSRIQAHTNDRVLSENGATENVDTDIKTCQMMLITGPNMAGKSVYIKQTALLVIMAQCGYYVPAESLKITTSNAHLFDAVFTRIGESDRLVVGSSTFMQELSETSIILSESTAKSFVVLDELGRGTSTHDGMAIAYSCIDYFVRRTGCCLLFVTHYHGLTEMIDKKEYASKIGAFHMAFLETTVEDRQRITFLHKLKAGMCPNSFGINVAMIAGIETSIIESAVAKSKKMIADQQSDKQFFDAYSRLLHINRLVKGGFDVRQLSFDKSKESE